LFLQFTGLMAVGSAVNRPSLSSEARATYLPAYLRALTELLDPEIDLLLQLMADRKVHPMGIKTLLAGDMTAAVHGIDQAEASRAGFSAQFSTKRFSDTLDLPVITHAKHGESAVANVHASPCLCSGHRGLSLGCAAAPGDRSPVAIRRNCDGTQRLARCSAAGHKHKRG
jgi:hypothetical protein